MTWTMIAFFLVGVLITSVEAVGAQSINGAGGFRDEVVFTGLAQPTDLAFAANGHVFVAEKRGTIQVFENLDDPAPTQIVDVRSAVHNFWDRGLLSLAIHPDYPLVPWLYFLYTEDAPPGEAPPWWGEAGQDEDACSEPPGPLNAGCVGGAVLARVLVDVENLTASAPQPLLRGWCQQFPSHSIGDLVFGKDGALYVTAGDGAASHAVDTGQLGQEFWVGNPCGDPKNEGGALRSQDLLTLGDPVGWNGSVLRVSPETGDAFAGNPLAGKGATDDDRVIAFGLRNPFRAALDPATGALYVADVGWTSFEEVNRIPDPTDEVIENFGWPCREGPVAEPSYAATALCQFLENGSPPIGTLTEPLLAIDHASPPDPDRCTDSGSFLTGISFGGSGYAAPWNDSLFVVDSGSGCLWSMPRSVDGTPDPASIRTFPIRLLGATSLVDGPGGELYYPNFFFGRIHRLRSDPDLLFADDFEYGVYRWDGVSDGSTREVPRSLAVQFPALWESSRR